MSAAERLTLALADLAEHDQHTPCQGRRAERWTSDSTADLEWAAWHCTSMACPVLDLCGETADEDRIRWHVWGGTVRSAKPRATT